MAQVDSFGKKQIMKAIVITAPGGPEVLRLQDRPIPNAMEDEVLIKVNAAGINRADIAQRKGNYPVPAGASKDILGLEVAGIVSACGPKVTQWKVGDAVCALLNGGGYAEYVTVKEGQCLPIPKNLDFIAAASLPETVFTVWSNIFQIGKLRQGETLLVHGGSSGIGITAIQIAKAFGAQVFVTAGTEEKVKACLQLGADNAVNYKTHDFAEALGANTVDVILDMVGGEYLAKNIAILKPEGRLVYINAMNGAGIGLDIFKVMQKRINITGSMLRGREYPFKQQLAAAVKENVWPMIENEQFKPVIYKTFPLSEAAEAHRLMESSEHIGKIILVNE